MISSALSLLSSLLQSSSSIARRLNCRLYLSEYHSNHPLSSSSYSIYSIEGENKILYGYHYEVIFVSDSVLDIAQLADTECSIVFKDEINPLSAKTLKGHIASIGEYGSVFKKELYKLTLVSPLHYLNTNKKSEIFQDKNVPTIISTILNRYEELLGLTLINKCDPSSYPIRHTTTQYFQSDLEFITMLCEEEGLVLLSDESNTNHTLCEATSHAKVLSESIEATFNASKHFHASLHSDDAYDFTKPSLELSHTSKSTIQSFKDNPTTTRLRNTLRRESFHERLEREDSTLIKDLKRYGTLNTQRSYALNESIQGESTSLELFAGSIVTLKDTKAFKEQSALIVHTTTHGFFPNALDELINTEEEQKEQYLVTFKALPASTPYHPATTITKPRIDGIHTAIVSKGDKETTKGANEIDVNDKGEIRVIMHFDPHYPTSVYVPLSTLYTGDNYGTRFLPRVNSEVLISYINGNIDKPIITGMLHNGENKIPYDLPSTKTQSYIKTQTTPQYEGEEGYNEILFEDAQHNEQLNLRAQKDYNLLVLNDAREHIGHDRTERVDNNDDVTIQGYRTERVNKSKTETIDIAKALTIGAGYQVSVGASKNETIAFSSTEEVGVYKYVHVGEKYEVSVGDTRLTMYANGTITIEGNDIDLTATEHLELNAPKVYIDKGAWSPEPICWECMMNAMKKES